MAVVYPACLVDRRKATHIVPFTAAYMTWTTTQAQRMKGRYIRLCLEERGTDLVEVVSEVDQVVILVIIVLVMVRLDVV